MEPVKGLKRGHGRGASLPPQLLCIPVVSQASKGCSKVIASFHDPHGRCSWPEMKMQVTEARHSGKVRGDGRCLAEWNPSRPM